MRVRKERVLTVGLVVGLIAVSIGRAEQPLATTPAPEKIIIDTDIGTDIDDAFAMALALQSPGLKILGVSTVSGDTNARAKIVDEMLGESGHPDVPVVAGNPTTLPFPLPPVGHQSRFGENGRFAKATHRSAVDFILEQIHHFPGQITLVAIGPLTNVAGLIDKDPQAFHQLKRVVMMGGSIAAVEVGTYGTPDYDTVHYDSTHALAPEYNILCDIPAAKKLFQSGVPIYVIPLDSTAQLTMDEVKREVVFSKGTPLTNSLTVLYHLWGATTPVLYDAMAVAYVLDPELCPVQPTHIGVDEKGVTRSEPGEPNAQVCLNSNPEKFFHFYMARFQ